MPTGNARADAAASRGLMASARHTASQIVARFMPAPITWLKPHDGTPTDITSLQAERERLIADLREARRKHRSTSRIADRLQVVTLEILKGVRHV